MSRGVLIYGTLLLVALAASYLSWTQEDVDDADAVVVIVPGEADDIEGVEYSSEKLAMQLAVKKDDRGRYGWAKVTETKEKRVKKPDVVEADAADGDGAPESTEEDASDHSQDDGHGHGDESSDDDEPADDEEVITETTVTEFKVGSAGDEMLEKLAPLQATRALDTVTDEKLADLGLAEPDGQLTILRKGKPPRVIELGGEAYGTRDRYVRDTETGRVYLVDDAALRPLKFAKTRLPDRDLVNAKEEDLVKVQVSSGSANVALEHRNHADADAAFWAQAGEEVADETAATWLDKLMRLRSAGYVQPDEAPSDLEPAFSATVETAEGEATKIEVLKGLDSEGEEAWYARSQHTRELVKLHKVLASEAAEDLDAVFNSAD